MLLKGCIRKYGITFTISVTIRSRNKFNIQIPSISGEFFSFFVDSEKSIYALLIKATWFYLQFYMGYYYHTRHDGRSTCTDPIFQIIMISLSLSYLTNVYDFFFTPVSPIITKPVIIMDQRVGNTEVITIRSHANY